MLIFLEDDIKKRIIVLVSVLKSYSVNSKPYCCFEWRCGSNSKKTNLKRLFKGIMNEWLLQPTFKRSDPVKQDDLIDSKQNHVLSEHYKTFFWGRKPICFSNKVFVRLLWKVQILVIMWPWGRILEETLWGFFINKLFNKLCPSNLFSFSSTCILVLKWNGSTLVFL